MDQRLKYLLDTDMCIYLLNGNEQVKARLAREGIDSIAVAIITVAELYFGAYNSTQKEKNLTRVRGFFSPPGPTVLSIDDAAAECFGKFKAELRQAGQPVGDLDLFIASVASTLGLTVVTNNTKHFERLPGISMDNWLATPETKTD